MKKQISFGILILVVFTGFFLVKGILKKEPAPNQPAPQKEQENTDELKIISTNPDPLEGATILPAQDIEIKFNRQMSVSEFKHRFDPEIEHDVEATNDNKDNTTTMKIIFKKPLGLGNGYTLSVLSNTNGVDKKELGRQYDYHFSTIKYKGV